MLDRLGADAAAWLRTIGFGAFEKIALTLLILVVGLFLIRVITNFVRKALLRSRLEKAAHSMIIGVVRVLLYALLGINAASSLGIDITGVVALALSLIHI